MSAKQEVADRIKELMARLVVEVAQAEQLGLQVKFTPASKFDSSAVHLQVEVLEITNY